MRTRLPRRGVTEEVVWMFSRTLPFALWEVEGLLIACWLVLQDDVEQVKYEPATGTYSIKKDNLGDILRQFLTDMDALLYSKQPETTLIVGLSNLVLYFRVSVVSIPTTPWGYNLKIACKDYAMTEARMLKLHSCICLSLIVQT